MFDLRAKTRQVAFILLISLLLCQFGCTESQQVAGKDSVESGPIFYPKPPDPARIQFLRAFTGIQAEATGNGGFSSFILGDDEEKAPEGGITKPYGMAIFEGKIYISDIDQRRVVVLDSSDETYKLLTEDRRIINPLGIFIDAEGNKYVADPKAKAVFVFNREDTMTAIMLRDLGIYPMDVVVRGDKMYVVDMNKMQIVVVNKSDGSEILRFGKKGSEPGQFKYIGGMAVDEDENIYVTDKITASITIFDKDGIFVSKFGKPTTGVHDFVRPKGIDVDREGRMWIVDAATGVAKIYDQEQRLLLYFGLPDDGAAGALYFPIGIRIDYDNIEHFRSYAVDGAEIEAIILIANQFGKNKISVYALGTFPQ